MDVHPPRRDGNLPLRLWLQLMKCAKGIEADVSGRFRRSFDQSLARFDVLSQLYRMPDHRASIGEIADSVMAASGNITALIDRMVDEGLVERRANPNDRRSSQVTMTPLGHTLFRDMTVAHGDWMRDALSDLSEDEMAALVGLLRKTRQSVEKQQQRRLIRAGSAA